MIVAASLAATVLARVFRRQLTRAGVYIGLESSTWPIDRDRYAEPNGGEERSHRSTGRRDQGIAAPSGRDITLAVVFVV